MKLADFITITAKALKDKLEPLVKEQKTGKLRFDIEVNLSQGGIGDVFIENHTKERIKE